MAATLDAAPRPGATLLIPPAKLAGNDLRTMSEATRAILTDKDVIAVDQDPLGKQAVRVSTRGDLEVWARPLADGGHAVGLFNRATKAATATARWSEIGISGAHHVRDLWAHEDRGEASGEFAAEVPAHGVVLIKVAP